MGSTQKELRRSLTREALAIAGVRGIVVAFGAVTVAEWILATAVAIAAYDVGGALAVGLIGFRFVPAALAGLSTALLSERFGHARVLIGTALVRAAAAAATAAALGAGLAFGVVIAFLWLDTAVGSAFRPAQARLLPVLVRTPGQLSAAASLTSNAKTLGQVLAPSPGAWRWRRCRRPARR